MSNLECDTVVPTILRRSSTLHAGGISVTRSSRGAWTVTDIDVDSRRGQRDASARNTTDRYNLVRCSLILRVPLRNTYSSERSDSGRVKVDGSSSSGGIIGLLRVGSINRLFELSDPSRSRYVSKLVDPSRKSICSVVGGESTRFCCCCSRSICSNTPIEFCFVNRSPIPDRSQSNSHT